MLVNFSFGCALEGGEEGRTSTKNVGHKVFSSCEYLFSALHEVWLILHSNWFNKFLSRFSTYLIKISLTILAHEMAA
jgi:hypothetical protein